MECEELWVQTEKDGKYGRILGQIWCATTCINEEMVYRGMHGSMTAAKKEKDLEILRAKKVSCLIEIHHTIELAFVFLSSQCGVTTRDWNTSESNYTATTNDRRTVYIFDSKRNVGGQLQQRILPIKGALFPGLSWKGKL